MSLTNKGLVEYCKKCLDLGNHSIYVYGTFGQRLTNSLISQKVKQYPSQNKSRELLYKNALRTYGNVYAFDCVGLIKSYLWGGYGNVKYNAKQDVSANGMVQVAKVKGNISTLPERPGVLVQMNGHIGVYIGNKEVIECTPNKTYAKQAHKAGGVCKTKLSARKWTNWCECPWIEYEKKESNNDNFIHNDRVKSWQIIMNKVYNCKLEVDGSYGKKSQEAANKHPLYKKALVVLRIRNDYVVWLQNRLKELGYNISVDGSFWKDTDKVVRQFQRDRGLKVDGKVGANTVRELLK